MSSSPPPPSSAGPTSDYAISLDIQNVLQYIGNTFIKPDNITKYLGSKNDIDGFINTNDTNINFIQSLLKGYVSFKTRYANSLPAIDMSSANMATISINTLISRIMVRDISKSSNLYVDGSNIVTSTSSFLPRTMEINFSKLINETGGDISLLNELNSIRATYSVLSDENIKKYKSRVPFNVAGYIVYSVDNKNISDLSINPENPSDIEGLNSVIRSVISNNLDGIDNFDFTNNDVFVIRRLMLLYELLTNIYISMYLYDKAVDAGVSNDLQTKVLNIVTNTSRILISLNNNVKFNNDTGDLSRATIIQNVRNSISSYKENSTKITDTDNKIRDLKISLMRNKNIYENGKNDRKRMANYEKITIVMFVISLLLIISFAVSPIDRTIKIATCSSVLVLLIISAVILDMSYNKHIEGFNTYYLPDPNVFNSGADVSKKDNMLSLYNQMFHAEALDYLYNTIYLTNLLQTNRAYTTIDASIRREAKYFTEMQSLIENSNNKLAKYSANIYLDAAISSARVTFFVSLGIVIAAAVIAYVMIGDNLQYQPIILGVTGFIIFLILLRYLVEVSKYVRTDPSKFYWKQPQDNKALNNL